MTIKARLARKPCIGRAMPTPEPASILKMYVNIEISMSGITG